MIDAKPLYYFRQVFGCQIEVRFRVGSKTVTALDAVDLEVPAGQFVVVRGRSGSGKTRPGVKSSK